jgi:hypothetical protein
LNAGKNPNSEARNNAQNPECPNDKSHSEIILMRRATICGADAARFGESK